MRIGRLAVPLLAAVLAVRRLRNRAPATVVARAEVVVGSRPDADSALLAGVYVAALRSYGFGARAATAADPKPQLDSGAFTVVPAFTGRTLQVLQPGATAMSDKDVYRAMIAALPEGVVAGDYTTAAEDKPVLLVSQPTAKAWGGSDVSADLSTLPRHCDGLVVGAVAGHQEPVDGRLAAGFPSHANSLMAQRCSPRFGPDS